MQFDLNNAERVRAVEVIAQVPAGTCAAVQQYRAAAAQLAYTGDAGYQLWPSVQGTPVAALDELLAYG